MERRLRTGGQGRQAESYEPAGRLQVFLQRRHLSYSERASGAAVAARVFAPDCRAQPAALMLKMCAGEKG